MPNSEPARVSQADRDAAAPIFRLYGAPNYAALCEKGTPHCDGLALVQAFARHRLASTPPTSPGWQEIALGLHESLADCVKRLRRCAVSMGNAPYAVDALCEQFEAVLARTPTSPTAPECGR